MEGFVVLARVKPSPPENIPHAREINFLARYMAHMGETKIQLTYNRDESYNRLNERLRRGSESQIARSYTISYIHQIPRDRIR